MTPVLVGGNRGFETRIPKTAFGGTHRPGGICSGPRLHRMRIAKGLAGLVLGIVASCGVTKAQTPDADRPIQVRMSSESRITRAGEPLKLRVEIRNVGNTTVFIEKDLYRPCSQSPLTFQFDVRPTAKLKDRLACSADCLDDPNESHVNRFIKRWIPLQPDHFYGTVISLSPDFFPELSSPGRWRLRAKYISGGDLTSSLCLSPVPLDRQWTDALPYKAWRGQEDTNAMWIRVLPAVPLPEPKR